MKKTGSMTRMNNKNYCCSSGRPQTKNNNNMKNLFLFSLVILVLAGCKKENTEHNVPPVSSLPHPVMIYKSFEGTQVSYRRPVFLDIDNDGIKDFSFGVILVGDPILQRDRLQFYANSGQKRNLLNDEMDQSPVLNLMDPISKTYTGYTWYQLSAILLAEKIITFNGNYWDGQWKNASHKFLPVQEEKNGKLYQGWIEISFDTMNEVLIIHKSGISTEEGREVKAGY